MACIMGVGPACPEAGDPLVSPPEPFARRASSLPGGSVLTIRPGLLYLGGRIFGGWVSLGDCEQHRRRCTGLSRGSRFLELSLRGRTVGICW